MWHYKSTREIARRMPCYRGELAAAHPAFASASEAACTASASPVPVEAADLVYSAADDAALGGAFNTGDSLFDRAEAWYTDNMYLSPRRLFFGKAAPLQPLFGYFFTEFIPGNNRTLGGESSVHRSRNGR